MTRRRITVLDVVGFLVLIAFNGFILWAVWHDAPGIDDVLLLAP